MDTNLIPSLILVVSLITLLVTLYLARRAENIARQKELSGWLYENFNLKGISNLQAYLKYLCLFQLDFLSYDKKTKEPDFPYDAIQRLTRLFGNNLLAQLTVLLKYSIMKVPPYAKYADRIAYVKANKNLTKELSNDLDSLDLVLSKINLESKDAVDDLKNKKEIMNISKKLGDLFMSVKKQAQETLGEGVLDNCVDY